MEKKNRSPYHLRIRRDGVVSEKLQNCYRVRVFTSRNENVSSCSGRLCAVGPYSRSGRLLSAAVLYCKSLVFMLSPSFLSSGTNWTSDISRVVFTMHGCWIRLHVVTENSGCSFKAAAYLLTLFYYCFYLYIEKKWSWFNYTYRNLLYQGQRRDR